MDKFGLIMASGSLLSVQYLMCVIYFLCSCISGDPDICKLIFNTLPIEMEFFFKVPFWV